jgi:hypothetical protein
MDLDGMVMDSDGGALELGLLGGGFSRLVGWLRRWEDDHRSARLNPAESLMERSSSRRNTSRSLHRSSITAHSMAPATSAVSCTHISIGRDVAEHGHVLLAHRVEGEYPAQKSVDGPWIKAGRSTTLL